jgi:hypothetical protein
MAMRYTRVRIEDGEGGRQHRKGDEAARRPIEKTLADTAWKSRSREGDSVGGFGGPQDLSPDFLWLPWNRKRKHDVIFHGKQV